jgi:two-component system response regulator AtoC
MRVGDSTPNLSGAAPAGRASFVLIAGHGRLITHVIDKPELVIGRDPGCDLAIEHASLSRRHAVLRLGLPVTIQDLGSTNGTRVARRTSRGGPPIVLEHGETFHIGGFAFNVVAADSSTSSTTSRSGRDRLRVEDPTEAGAHGFVREVAVSSTSVLIQGESGVGKDVLAETLHVWSGRTGDLARVNCAALAEPLIESELFGHEKGAFTGASSTKVGLLESAQGGTVFLDEIGELPPGIQAKLLRAIESREILRIGSIRPTQIDVRFIAATNRDLPLEVAAKRFRHDLYFRLDGITLVIPPLRERRDQIALLATRFLAAAAKRAGRADARLAPDAIAHLAAHDWPGNVRELKAVIERGLLLSRHGEVGARHLAFSPRVDGLNGGAAPPVAANAAPSGGDGPLLVRLTVEERIQREQLIQALETAAGNQSRAAKALGISRATVVHRIRLFQLARPRR